MKRKCFIVLLIVYLSSFCNAGYSQNNIPDFKKLDWISGTWKRTEMKKGESGFEYWNKISDTLWQGRGITMNGGDTTLVEKLTLMIKNKRVYYIVDIPANPEPVWYRITNITDEGFASENLEYDFPKQIEYHLNGNRLKATISGNGRFINYSFKKQKG
ncbi:MAG: hypothetical protein ABUT20_23375 [Bacteroidota bacterium]